MSDKKKGKPTTFYLTRYNNGKQYSLDNVKLGCKCMSNRIFKYKCEISISDKNKMIVIRSDEDGEERTYCINCCMSCGAEIKFVVNVGQQ